MARRSHHNFKFYRKIDPYKTKHGLVILSAEKGLPVEYAYRCNFCDSEIRLKTKMSDGDVNRDIAKHYPQFQCIDYKEKVPGL